MKKIILLMLMVVMMTTFVVATDPISYFKKGDISELKIPCSDDGAPCSLATECNITIDYPNGTTFAYRQTMTNNIVDHNYTLDDTSVMGTYTAKVYCRDGADAGNSLYLFDINLKGSKPSEILPLGMYIVLGIVVFVYLYSSFKLDKEHMEMKIILFFISLGNAVGGLFLAFFMSQNYSSDITILTFATINVLTLMGVIWFYFKNLFWKLTLKDGFKGEDRRN